MNTTNRFFIIILTISFLFFSCDAFKKVGQETPSTPTDEVEPEPEPTPIEVLVPGSAKFDYWIHSPLHPTNNTPVIFKVKASDQANIVSVELHVYEYELYMDDLNLPSKRRRADGQWGLLKLWDIDDSQKAVDLTYRYNTGFPAESNVEYIFKIINENNEVTEQLALFDAGTSPWETDKILLYSTTRNPLKQTINLCFLPDTDFNQDWNKFLADTENLIYKGFHSSNVVENEKGIWNFFYTKQEANGSAIRQLDINAFPAFVKDSLIRGVDAFGLLHLEDYGDGAFLNSNFHFLAQSIFTSESFNWGTAIHEAAHALFALSDEYDGCYCFANKGGTNVFETASTCEAFNRKHGFTPADCTELTGGINNEKWYMAEQNVMFESLAECEAFNIANGYPQNDCSKFIDINQDTFFRAESGVCIMQDDGDNIVHPFKRACAAVIKEYIANLDRPLEELAYGEDLENIFGYEPIILLEMDMVKSNMEIDVMNVEYGVPTKNNMRASELDLEVMTSAGAASFKIGLHRPDMMHVHGAEGHDMTEKMNNGKVLIAVPYNKDISEVVCKMPNNNQITARGIGDPVMTIRKFKVKDKINFAMKKSKYLKK